MARKTKINKSCRGCIATSTQCEECKNKSNYKKAEKPICTECKYCDLKMFYRGQWYCNNPNISIFEPPYSFEDCFTKR